MRAAVRWFTPTSPASSRVGGSFSPASSSPESIALAKRSTTCCVSETAPSRSSSDKLILYDIEDTVRSHTLPLQRHTDNGCTTQEVTHAEHHGEAVRFRRRERTGAAGCTR